LAATIILVLALRAVSEIVLPLTFAAVLAVIFKPVVGMDQLIMQTQMHRRTT
jgi:predicted PurR-regulated permease PerM